MKLQAGHALIMFCEGAGFFFSISILVFAYGDCADPQKFTDFYTPARLSALLGHE